MPRIIETTVYTFAELVDKFGLDSKPVKRVVEFEMASRSEFWSADHYCKGHMIEIGALMGIDIDNIWYSLSYSQGDGACFEGTYAYKKGSVKAIKEEYPADTKLHKIAEGLQEIQKRHFYGITATVKQSGHYQHEYCTTIEADHNRAYEPYTWDSDNPDDYEALVELLRDFMRYIFAYYQEDYEYQTSEEVAREYLSESDHEFTEHGKIV